MTTPIPPEQRVTIVTVTYNSADVVEAMLSSVPSTTSVVISDNGSNDLVELRKLAARTDARLIENQSNQGFGVACNIGAAKVATEFVLFLNPDAILLPDTLANLVHAAEKYPKASGFNPRLEGHDGSPFFKRKSHILPRSKWMPRGWPKQDKEVSVLSGAAMFMSCEDFNKTGGFDPEIFLFHEDDDLALRLAKECGPLMFIRDAVVKHGGGSSTIKKNDVARLKAWHMGHSRVYASRKHKIKLARSYAVIQSALQVISPLVLLSSRKRAKQVAFFRGVMQASLGLKNNKRIEK